MDPWKPRTNRPFSKWNYDGYYVELSHICRQANKKNTNITLFPRQPMIPRLVLAILKWLTCGTSSFLIQIVTKMPTICLLAMRPYFISLLLSGMAISEISKTLGSSSSSSSSEEIPSSLTCDGWHRNQKSLLRFLSSSGGVQLQLFSFLLLTVPKVLLMLLREGFGKKSEPPRLVVGFTPLVEPFDGLFNDWLIKASHLAAGSLSSMTKTFPAFRGTISWKLIIKGV